jgi:hypothetical protein
MQRIQSAIWHRQLRQELYWQLAGQQCMTEGPMEGGERPALGSTAAQWSIELQAVQWSIEPGEYCASWH